MRSAGAALLLVLVLHVTPGAGQPRRQFALHAGFTAVLEAGCTGYKAETIATGFGFTEGPVWDTARRGHNVR